jgi:LemA protein
MEVLIVLAVPILVLLYFLGIFNRLVSLRQLVSNAWSNIDTELKRRYDLIPNLVETVKGYAAHERDVLERVVAARARLDAGADAGPTREHARDENDLAAAVRQLFAVVEGYPDLKANQQFLELQRALVTTEDRIQAARRFHNGNVKDLNTLIEQFPSSLVARMGGFRPVEFFEVDSVFERRAPVVNLGS